MASIYDNKDVFWKNVADLPGSPYKLSRSLGGLNCLFIYPSRSGDLSRGDYPLALGYMASLVRMNGGRAEIQTQDVGCYPRERFRGLDLICFYPMIGLFEQTLRFAERVKIDHPDTRICFVNSDQHQHEMILCAPKAKDFAMKLLVRHRWLDYALVGEAEGSLVRLCGELAAADQDFSSVPACAYRDGKEIRFSSRPVEPLDFASLPWASRDYLETTISPEGINSHSPRIQSSRGCCSPCLYCAESSSNITEGGRRQAVIGKAPADFLDEIVMLQKDYGVVFFNVIDSSFEDPGKKGLARMMDFCKEIAARKIEASFKIHLRAETVDRLEDSALDVLKDAGVDIIIPGVESGLEKELRSYKKLTNPGKSRKTVLRLEAYGKFFSVLGHMMFSPILTLDDLPVKLEYLQSLHHEWDYLNLSNNIIIFPGTAYHREMQARGLALERDELSPTVPYTFADPRVAQVARGLADWKNACPEIIQLNNRLYDAKNIISRYGNRMNRHLRANASGFSRFQADIEAAAAETGRVQSALFLGLADAAGSGWTEGCADMVFRKRAEGFFPSQLERTEKSIKGFLADCESQGLSTSKLYLRTWMSLINTQISTAGGMA